MATTHEEPEARRRPLDPADIVFNLIVWALRLAFYVLSILVMIAFGMMGLLAGLSAGGWVGWIAGILGLFLGGALGAAMVVAAVFGVWIAALGLILLLAYTFSLDHGAPALPALKPGGGEPSGTTRTAFWPPPHYRSAAIILATILAWSYCGGWAALRDAREWGEFWEVAQVAILLPLSFIGMVAHPWLSDLGEWMGRHPGPATVPGPGAEPSPCDMELPDFLRDRGP